MHVQAARKKFLGDINEGFYLFLMQGFLLNLDEKYCVIFPNFSSLSLHYSFGFVHDFHSLYFLYPVHTMKEPKKQILCIREIMKVEATKILTYFIVEKFLSTSTGPLRPHHHQYLKSHSYFF